MSLFIPARELSVPYQPASPELQSICSKEGLPCQESTLAPPGVQAYTHTHTCPSGVQTLSTTAADHTLTSLEAPVLGIVHCGPLIPARFSPRAVSGAWSFSLSHALGLAVAWMIPTHAAKPSLATWGQTFSTCGTEGLVTSPHLPFCIPTPGRELCPFPRIISYHAECMMDIMFMQEWVPGNIPEVFLFVETWQP